jgi:hypothetical protein
MHFAADLAEGRIPSARQIKKQLHVGQDRANDIRDYLASLTAAGSQDTRQITGRIS